MEVSQRKLTGESFRMGLCLRVWAECPLASGDRPGRAVEQQWSLKLPPVWPWESEWGDRQLEQLNTCRGREESKRRRGETAHSYPPNTHTHTSLPPSLWPPALPSSTLKTPSPWPPRMQIPGLWAKDQISKSIQIAGRTTHRFTHLAPHLPTILPPLAGHKTHLVSFKLNPRKSPKLSHPSYSHLPPIYLYLPSPSFSLFFFSIKQLKPSLSSDLTCRIFIAGRVKLMECGQKLESGRQRESVETYLENLSS